MFVDWKFFFLRKWNNETSMHKSKGSNPFSPTNARGTAWFIEQYWIQMCTCIHMYVKREKITKKCVLYVWLCFMFLPVGRHRVKFVIVCCCGGWAWPSWSGSGTPWPPASAPRYGTGPARAAAPGPVHPPQTGEKLDFKLKPTRLNVGKNIFFRIRFIRFSCCTK